MGRGSYTANDWSQLRSSKQLSQQSEISDVFNNKTALSSFDTKYIKDREARDNTDSPYSTPVIIGFDVTASMGYLAKELAVNSINNTVLEIYSNRIIPCPQILCSAIGDCKSDVSPLQVTQFEADIRIIKQLTDLYLEGGGGGNDGESYNLLWYFASRHTKTDCNEKRHKKGYLFTIGDDKCHPDLSVSEVRRVFNDTIDYPISNDEILRLAREKYNIFHIHIETGNYNDQKIFTDWQELMPGCCTMIHKNDIQYLSNLITSIIAVSSGIPANKALQAINQDIAEKISRSMALIQINNKNKITF